MISSMHNSGVVAVVFADIDDDLRLHLLLLLLPSSLESILFVIDTAVVVAVFVVDDDSTICIDSLSTIQYAKVNMRFLLSTIRCHGVLLACKLRAFSGIYGVFCLLFSTNAG